MATKPTPKSKVKINRSQNKQEVRDRKDAYLKILEKSMGVKSTACAAMGLSRSCVYLWIKEDPDFAAAVTDIEEVALDYAESRLFLNMKAGTSGQASVIFFLKTKGKRRGYIEEQHIGNSPEHPFGIEITEKEAAAIANRVLASR